MFKKFLPKVSEMEVPSLKASFRRFAMAQVTNIRSTDFNEGSEEFITLGECSNCGHHPLFFQYTGGFLVRCPKCNEALLNGTDSREWLQLAAARALLKEDQWSSRI
jgi:ribosomal protein S27E